MTSQAGRGRLRDSQERRLRTLHVHVRLCVRKLQLLPRVFDNNQNTNSKWRDSGWGWGCVWGKLREIKLPWHERKRGSNSFSLLWMRAFPCYQPACLPLLSSHTNCFQFNENFNRKALWLPKFVRASLASTVSVSLLPPLSLSLLHPTRCTCHNSGPKAVVVSVNVACIKCIKDADSHIWQRQTGESRENQQQLRQNNLHLISCMEFIWHSRNYIQTHSHTHSQQT